MSLSSVLSLSLLDPRRSSRTPGSRFIDPRGQRFGAGVSAAILLIAFSFDLPVLAVAVGLNLAISAAFGSRYFLPGRPWPSIRRALSLGPIEPEHEFPPRFAQAMGATFLILAGLAFASGAPLVGWSLAAAVGALQTLLAVTGICVGCRLYFLRWMVPDLFARLAGRSEAFLPVPRQRLRRPDGTA